MEHSNLCNCKANSSNQYMCSNCKKFKGGLHDVDFNLPLYMEALLPSIDHSQYCTIIKTIWKIGRYPFPSEKISNIKLMVGESQSEGKYVYVGQINKTTLARTNIGLWFYEKGGFYEGYWSEDMPKGHGWYIWGNGDFYKGLWSSGIMHDDGEYTLSQGISFKGKFEMGQLADPKLQSIFKGVMDHVSDKGVQVSPDYHHSEMSQHSNLSPSNISTQIDKNQVDYRVFTRDNTDYELEAIEDLRSKSSQNYNTWAINSLDNSHIEFMTKFSSNPPMNGISKLYLDLSNDNEFSRPKVHQWIIDFISNIPDNHILSELFISSSDKSPNGFPERFEREYFDAFVNKLAKITRTNLTIKGFKLTGEEISQLMFAYSHITGGVSLIDWKIIDFDSLSLNTDINYNFRHLIFQTSEKNMLSTEERDFFISQIRMTNLIVDLDTLDITKTSNSTSWNFIRGVLKKIKAKI